MRTVTSLVVLLMLAVCPALRAADPARITQEELVRRTQELYDAVATGERGPWQRYFAEDAMVFDEKGRDMDKKALVEDVAPLPKGYSGTIRLVKPKARFAADVAVLSYDCEETETVFGEELHARYHSTDTWLRRQGLWQIVASQTLRFYEDPAAGAVSDKVLADYVGRYELAPGTVLTVTVRGHELYAQRGSGAPYRLLPETMDLFFRPGAEGRKLFHRDASGRVDMLIDRRNNEDLHWKRTT